MSLEQIAPVLNRLIAYLEVAQKKGAFSLRQSSDIFHQVQSVRSIYGQQEDKPNPQNSSSKQVKFSNT